MGTDDGGFGGGGGLAEVSVMTFPPQAGSNSSAKIMGEIRSITTDLAGPNLEISLRNLGVLCVSAVNICVKA